LNSSRLYLHLGMFFLQRGDQLCQHLPNGTTAVPPAAQESYANAIRVLEKGSDIDRAFNEVNRTKQLLRGDDPQNIADVGLAPVYSTMGLAYSRLRIFDEAFKRFQYQRQLDPSDSDSYLKIALLQADMKHPQDAAISMIQAILTDQNPQRMDYWSILSQIYGGMGDAGKNAIVVENGSPRLNIADSTSPAREQLAYAYRDFIRIFRRAHLFAKAQQARQDAVVKYGYPPAMFDSLFEEPIETVTPHGMLPPGETPAAAAK
jgi:tetratricopeptide (TPR) repeat protein